jgi:hypothetical protein
MGLFPQGLYVGGGRSKALVDAAWLEVEGLRTLSGGFPESRAAVGDEEEMEPVYLE